MTKNTPHKRAIRVYMAEHGVNYTTAARALAAALNIEPTSSTDQSRLRKIPLSIDCLSCSVGDHEDHNPNWATPPGVIGGTYCGCVGDCPTRIAERSAAIASFLNKMLTAAKTQPPGGSSASTRIHALQAALATEDQETINAALRSAAPGPDPWDVAYALAGLAHDIDTLSATINLTADSSGAATTVSTPAVSIHVLRSAVHATATNGHHVARRYGQTASDICSAALLADPAIADNLHTGRLSLARALQHLAENAPALARHATDQQAVKAHENPRSAASESSTMPLVGDDLAEALLLVAHDLIVDANRAIYPRPETATYYRQTHQPHVLVVTADPATPGEFGMDVEELADWRFSPDRDYTIECPGIQVGGCEGWEECDKCRFLTAEEADELDETGEAHGVEHQTMWFGRAVATGTCSLHAFADAWTESASDLNLPPGRYAIGHDWDEYCTLELDTNQS